MIETEYTGMRKVRVYVLLATSMILILSGCSSFKSLSDDELVRIAKSYYSYYMSDKSFEMDPERIDRAITAALAEAEATGVAGKEVTPYLLARVEALTGGESLTANRALVLDNARVGARLAVELAAL